MPWRKAELRGTEVYAKCTAQGELVASSGRVEIRYKLEGGKAYRAAKGNLTLVGDEILEDAEPTKAAASETSFETPKNAIVAYTDGACSGNPGPAGLGVVVADGGKLEEQSEYLGTATNNVAELTAILRALEATDPARPLVVFTDSQYAIGVLTKGWKAKANAELIATIRAVLKDRDGVAFRYVRGHAGIPLNERADELARRAITSR